MSARANNFDALRLLGALLVLGSHQFAVSGRWEPRLVGDHSFGNLGVLIFFAASGYLVTLSWVHDPNVLRFALRRALRLVPGIVALLFVTGLALALFRPGPFDAMAYARAPWSSQHRPAFEGNPMTMLNGSLWTIPIEIQCYLVLTAAGLLARRRLGLAVALGGLALLAWYLLRVGGQAGVDAAAATGKLAFLPYFGAFFLSGSMLALWPRWRQHGLLPLLPPLAGALCITLGQQTLGLALIVPTAVVLVGTQSWPVLRHAGRFGDLSYGTYLYAWPTQQFVVWTLGKEQPWLNLLLPSLTISLGLAWLSWHAVERCALAFKPRSSAPIEPAAPVARQVLPSTRP